MTKKTFFNDAVRKTVRVLLPFLAVWWQALLGSVVAGNIEFSRLNNRDGLTNSHIQAILKDHKGYMWFGTQAGLARYDGFRIKTFLYNNVNPKSLPNNLIDEIYQDADYNLWLHTALGYCILDYKHEEFDRQPEKRLAGVGIKGGIDKVFIDSRKNLWVSIYGKGCYFIDAKTRKPFLFYYSNANGGNPSYTLPGDQISHFSEHKGTVIVSFANGTFCCINGAEHHILWVNTALAMQYSASAAYTFADSRSNYWVLMGSETNIYSAVLKRWFKGVPSFLQAHGIVMEGRTPSFIRDMASTSDGRLWIATDHDGLLVVDYRKKTCQQYLKDEQNMQSLPDNSLQRIYIDNRDDIWIGSYKNGVAYFSPSLTRFSTLPLGDICTISQDGAGLLWCGTNDHGILSCNPLTGLVQRYGAQQTGLGSDVVVSSVVMSDGTVFFGTFNGGMARYRDGVWKTYKATPHGLANNSVWCLAEAPGHRLLIGTLGGGLQIMNTLTETFETYDMTNTKLPSNYISSIAKAKGDEVLLGHSQCVSLFNLKTHKMTTLNATRSGTPFPSPSVNYAMMDSRGIIWMASPAGITMYDPHNDQLESVNDMNGTQGMVGCAMVEARDHSMWLVSEFLLTRVRLEKGDDGMWTLSLSSYNSLDGLQDGQLNYRSACRLADGSIAVGGQEGVNIVPMNGIRSVKRSVGVLFSGLVLFDHPLVAGEEYEGRVVLKEALDCCRQLELDYSDNAFTIQLASDDVAIPSRSRFLYRMEGVSDKWLMTTESKPSVTFTNLSPGNYTLQVKVVNGDGTVSEEISELRIHVRPPFYMSPVAILLYVLLAVAIFFYYRKRMLDRQRAKYEREKMEENVRKTEELNELKLNFFTNVSHELRTPLTLIISPLVTMEKEEQDSGKRHKLQLIHRNALRLLSLVNQILDFRKVEKSSDNLVLSNMDIVSFVKNICNSFRQLANSKITMDFQSAIPKLVMAFDVDKVGKIVNNLLSNAYKFTPDGGSVSVGLNVFVREDKSVADEDMLRITVTDTGRGVSDADKEKVFGRFYQVNGTEMLPYGGSGIGLNLVMQFARMHGGSARVEDNPGGGAVFIVDIPVRHQTASDVKLGETLVDLPMCEQPVAVTEETSEGQIHAVKQQSHTERGGMKPIVMLVDDSDDFREFMHEQLSPDYCVVEAVNGQDAWEKIQQQRPAVILSDVMMPVMDGNALCRLVKGTVDLATIPFVMLTARLADEHRKEGFGNGADAYVTKPFDVDLLKTRIDNFLRSSCFTAVGVEHDEADNAEKTEQNPEFKLTETDRKFLASVDTYIHDNMGDPDASVEGMSCSLCISRVQLYKRMLALTGTTPSEYMRAKRIRHAEELMHTGEYNVSEIAYKVGFNNPRYFSKYFQEAYGMTPSQYKRKLNG